MDCLKYTIDDNYQNYKFKCKMKDNQTLYDVRLELEKIYGWDSNSLVFTFVHDKQIIHLFNSTMTVKEIDNHSPGVILVYQCPQDLKP